jgi:peptidoglycan/LPS O-acetylase OafA/YrhL
VWVNSFVQFQFFAAGGLIALWLYESQQTLSAPARCCLAIGGLALWYFAMVHFHLSSGISSNPTQLVCGYLLVLAGTTMIFLSPMNLKMRIPQPLVYLGKISFGLYLFHELFIDVIFRTSDLWPQIHFFQRHPDFSGPVAFSLTVAAAALSYHFFERPILKFKERFETIHTRPA